MCATMTKTNFEAMGVTMKPKQVSNTLGIGLRQVQRLAAAGKLPAFKVGNQWRFSTEKIRALVSGEGA